VGFATNNLHICHAVRRRIRGDAGAGSQHNRKEGIVFTVVTTPRRNCPKTLVTIRTLLEHRRKELLDFLSWRFGTRYCTGPFCYSTGLPRWLAVKLRCRKTIEFSPVGRPCNVLTIRDILRLEDAALHLGFRPTLPGTVDKRYLRPPPCNLPPATDPSVRIRFKLWQQQNPRDKIPKAERKLRKISTATETARACPVSEEIAKSKNEEKPALGSFC